MLGTHDLWLFVLTALVVAVTPGVDLLYTVTQTLRFGRRGGVVAAAGILGGCTVHVLAATFGLSAVLAASAGVFTVVKYIGAAYLLWLGGGLIWRALFSPSAVAGAAAAAADVEPARAPRRRLDGRRIFWQGFAGNVTNPKVALFFLALLPQFVDAESTAGDGLRALAFVVLGMIFIAVGAAVLGLVVIATGRLRRLRDRRGASEPWRRCLQAAGGALFVFFAVRLAMTGAPARAP